MFVGILKNIIERIELALRILQRSKRELASNNALTLLNIVIDQRSCGAQLNCPVGCQKAHWNNSMS